MEQDNEPLELLQKIRDHQLRQLTAPCLTNISHLHYLGLHQIIQ